MATGLRAQPWRAEPSAYGAALAVATRHADVDTRRHVNNIAVAGLHAEARWQWLMGALGQAVWPGAAPWLKPLAVVTEFWQQCHYPPPVAAGVRLLALAPQGLQLASALFQHGQAVGAQACWLGAWQGEPDAGAGMAPPPGALPVLLPAAWQALLVPRCQPLVAAAGGAALPPPRPAGADVPAHYPVHAALPSRYGDHDADGCSSEAAVLRGIEQARAALLQRAIAAAGGAPQRDWVRLLVARIALHCAGHPPPPPSWDLAGAVLSLGRSSAVLRVALFAAGGLQAVADCVMVYTDDDDRVAPLPGALRAALGELACWRGPTGD